MKRRFVTAVCSALAVGTALPAFALTSELTGFLRQKGIVADLQAEGKSNKTPDWLVDQRLRARYLGKVNDYLSFVYFAEVDFSFGDSTAAAGRNGGGGQDGDATNLETKNLYMIAKIPNTPLTISSGLQGFGDNWEGVISPFFDMAGIRVDAANLGGLGNLTVGWFKLAEGSANGQPAGGDPSVGGQFRREDDVNLWTVRFAMKPMGALKLGVDFYKLQNQDSNGALTLPAFQTPGRQDLYYVGPNFAYKVGSMDLSGWAFYNFGKMNNAAAPAVAGGAARDMDVSAWVASAKLSTSGKGWGAGLRAIYFSADDKAGDADQKSLVNPLGGQAWSNGVVTGLGAWPTFGGEGLNLMLGDATGATGYVAGALGPTAGNGFAMAEAQKGFGLLGFVVNGVYSPAAMPDLYVRGAAGYFQALEKNRGLNNTALATAGVANANDFIKDHDGKVLGTELSVRVGYKIAKNLDFSLNAAQAWLGDYYKKTANPAGSASLANQGTFLATRQNPDNPYIAYWLSTLTF